MNGGLSKLLWKIRQRRTRSKISPGIGAVSEHEVIFQALLKRLGQE
jgi:hypothetical protein